MNVKTTHSSLWISLLLAGIPASAADPERSADPSNDIVDAYRISFFDTPYEPSELKTVACMDGEKIGGSSVRIAETPAKLDVHADRTELNADGMDLCYVTLRMLDAQGYLCPSSMIELTFGTSGAAGFTGVANGDQMGMESLADNKHPLFYGQAAAVLRSRPGASGKATLSVSADNGLKAAVEVGFR